MRTMLRELPFVSRVCLEQHFSLHRANPPKPIGIISHAIQSCSVLFLRFAMVADAVEFQSKEADFKRREDVLNNKDAELQARGAAFTNS